MEQSGLKIYRRVLLAGAALGTLAGGGIAHAQDAAPQDAASSGDIVVTAQRREQNLKDVPLSISALSNKDVLAKGIRSIDDLTRQTPGISFNAGGSGIGVAVGSSNVEIRGVSSTAGSSTTGVYLDDVAISVDNKNGLGAPMPMLFDLGQLEVLRGPQGTLFGAGAEGGAIRYGLTQAKIGELSGKVLAEGSLTKHGGTNSMVAGVINLPLVENTLALRLNLAHSYDSGWIDNYGYDGKLKASGTNGVLTTFARAAINWEPSAAVQIKAEVTYQDTISRDTPVFYLNDTAYAEANPGAVPPPLATDGLYRQHKQVREPMRDRWVVPTLNAKFDLGFADLSSITSYYYRDVERQTDGTTYNSYVIATAFLGLPSTDRTIATLASPVNQPVTYKTWAQEIRLSSHAPAPGALPLRWTAGFYFNRQSANYQNVSTVPGLRSTFASLYGYDINSAESPIGYPAYPDLYDNDLVYSEHGKYSTDQYAVFGQVDFDVTPHLHAGAGVRYTSAVTKTSVTQYGFYAVGNFDPFFQRDKFHNFTPKFSLSYDVTPFSTVYASAGKGVRLGGQLYTPLPQGAGNVCSADYATFGLGDNPSSSYASDSLWSYELGTKGRTADGNLRFNLAGFFVDWSNVQQAILLPTCGYVDTLNIGNARTYGGEVELSYRVPAVDGLTVSVNGGVTHAELTSTNYPLAATAGQTILYTPKWSATVSGDYATPLSDAMTLNAHLDYAMTGPSSGSYQVSSPNYRNPEYGVMGASLGIDMGPWHSALFAKNLLADKTVIQSPTINSLVEGYTVNPRTVGIRVSRDF